jgi:hypothetical protein
VGDKVHIITRCLFVEDVHRHFAGEVTAVSGALFRARGYTFVFDSRTSQYQKRPEVRIRLFSIADPGHILNLIPREVDLGLLQYRTVDNRLVITDGGSFALDIHEFGPSS